MDHVTGAEHAAENTGERATSRPSLPVYLCAWAGAVLFVVSLTFFLYAYLVRFGTAPRRGARLLPAALDTALFSGFALHHSMFARTPLKEWVRRVVSLVLERSLYTWIASVLFIAVCWWWQPVDGVFYRV